ncbi:conserved hypothetical protein [Hyphomicrobiales bacterium]|nr:conserved hypothetical protein [Hyphomicrobiales bacterium]CAH1663933.1 conserved hypothetical protein [Hyphomicrobiales bacterium]
MTDVTESPRDLKAHLWARDEHDWYVEPRWTSMRLFQEERFSGRILDPACGKGRILDAARDVGFDTYGSDVIDRGTDGHRFSQVDWLSRPAVGWCPIDNIVSNPPFSHAEPFVRKALEHASGKVAMLLPSKWLHGDERSRWLQGTPLRRVLFLTPRPSMPPGGVLDAGQSPGGGRVDFAWFIWLKGFDGRPEIGWLRRDVDKPEKTGV